MRQELLFATYDIYPASAVASFLLTLASFVRSTGKALLRGDVVGPSTSLIPGVAANGVYAAMPVIFPDGIVKYSDSSPPTIAICQFRQLYGQYGDAIAKMSGSKNKTSTYPQAISGMSRIPLNYASPSASNALRTAGRERMRRYQALRFSSPSKWIFAL